MSDRSRIGPHHAYIDDVTARISSLEINSGSIKRHKSKEPHSVPLTYSRLRLIGDHQPKPRRVYAPHGRGSPKTTRQSPKVLKKNSWVGGVKESPTRISTVKELSHERVARTSSISGSSSGYDSPPVQARRLRPDRVPKRITGIGKDSIKKTVSGICKKQPHLDFDDDSSTLSSTLSEHISPLVRPNLSSDKAVVCLDSLEDEDDGIESWVSNLERQPGDGCTDEGDTWSDVDDVLSSLSAEEDGEDVDSTSLIQLDAEHSFLYEPPILPEIPLCSPLKRKQFLASCSPSKLAGAADGYKPVPVSDSTKTLVSCKRKLSANYRLPKRSQSLTFPIDAVQASPAASDEHITEKPITAPVRKPLAFNSLFANVPPTIYFPLPDEPYTSFPPEIRRLLKWKMSPITPNIIKQCIASVGFTKAKTNRWLGYWGKHMKSEAFKNIKPYQKVNHFPGTYQIGRKDRLWRTLSRMHSRFKKDYDFFPKTYILPNDTLLLRRDWDESANKKWIMKPPASARGIGIRVIHKWSQIPKKKPVIVQKYLSNPFLINGSKFDLRVYVYVTSYDPLRIYVFREGLARFATCKYSTSMKSLSNRFIHLTNYSINKKNSSFTPNTDETICQGHKWGLLALWSYMKTNMGIDTDAVWESIKCLVIKTIIASEPVVTGLLKMHVRRRSCCHELFGFDVMLDNKLKPWILEVNISPSLHSNSQLDVNIKGHMVRDILNMSNFPLPSEETFLDKPPDMPIMAAEKRKHINFIQRDLFQSGAAGILDDLTDDDIRMIMETEDELNRCGMFERVFPASDTLWYHQFFDVKRYYNLLLQEWTLAYHKQPQKGINLIRTLSKARNITY